MKRLTIALVFLAIAAGALKAADSTLGNLASGAAVSATDLFYDVQTVGIGGVKVTAAQLKTFMSLSPVFTGTVTFPDNGVWTASGISATHINNTPIGNGSPSSGVFNNLTSTGQGTINTLILSGISATTQCLHATNGVVSGTGVDCGSGGGGSTTSIAAGTNISTSGTATNVTVNVIASPSFTNVTASGTVTGSTVAATSFVTSPQVNTSATTSTLVSATQLTSTNGWFTGNLTATMGSVQQLTGTTLTFNSATIPQLTSTFGWITNLTSTGAQVGFLTMNSGNFGGFTVQTETLTSNLTGTTANFSSNLTAQIAQFPGFLSAGGASLTGLTIQTGTFSGNLTGTSANFSSNLTANIAQFPGFLSAGGGSLSGLTIATETLSSNLTGTTANFSSNLTAQIAQFPGFLSAGGASLSGLTIVTATYTGNLTGTTANFSGNLTAGTAQLTGLLTGTNAVFQTVTINNLTPTGPNCLQETGGVVQATNAACGSGGGTAGGAATDVQINTPTNAFGGDAGFTYQGNLGTVTIAPSNTLTALSLGLGQITTNTKGLAITAGWVSSGVVYDAPIFANIFTAGTVTGFASGTRLLDLQITGTTALAFSIGNNNVFSGAYNLDVGNSTVGSTGIPGNVRVFNPSGNPVIEMGGSLSNGNTGQPGIGASLDSIIVWQNAGFAGIDGDIMLGRTSNGELGLFNVPGGVANASGLQIYNTRDNNINGGNPTNYERAVLDWRTSTNTLTIGSQAGGTGSLRNVQFVGSQLTFTATNTIAMSISPTIVFYGQSNPSANETYAVCAGSGATSLTSGGQMFVDTTACLASSMMVKHDIAAFNTYGMERLESIAHPLHAERRLASGPIDVDPIAEAMALIPVVATYDTLDHNSPQFTLIAQNACQVDERLCERTRDGSIRAFRPNAVISILVAAIQKQQAEIDELRRAIQR